MNDTQVDYILVHQAGLKLKDLLQQKLIEAYETAYLEAPDDDRANQLLAIRYTRKFAKGVKEAFSGVSLTIEEFDDGEDGDTAAIVKNFTDAIVEAQEEGILHVVKLNDPILFRENAQYAAEIFEIEMKLREAFSVIFIDTVGDEFYSLIKDTSVNPMGEPQESQMRTRQENQFFYLTFSQYRNLNDKKSFGKNAEQLIKIIGQATDFRALQELLTQTPIKKEEYKDFITRLTAILDPIEDVRNCVAHNRTVSQREKDNYVQAKEKLMELINEFLNGFQK